METLPYSIAKHGGRNLEYRVRLLQKYFMKGENGLIALPSVFYFHVALLRPAALYLCPPENIIHWEQRILK